VLGRGKTREEIQIEILPRHGFIDRATPSLTLPREAGEEMIRSYTVTAPAAL
jgi:hypothetical protein